MSFPLWLETFLDEKDIDLTEVMEVEGPSGPNHIPIQVVVEHILITSSKEQHAIKDMLVKLDFHNANIKLYLKHLAKAIAK